MPLIIPGQSHEPIAIAPGLTLRPAQQWQGNAQAVPSPAVLHADPAGSATMPLQMFQPAAPPVELTISMAPTAVLGDEQAPGMLEYRSDEAGAYVLMQRIDTPDGPIYDFTLPQRPPSLAAGIVLGNQEAEHILSFPINPIAVGGARPPGAVLGLPEALGDLAGDFVFKRVLQVIKSPIDNALLESVRRAEGLPRILALRDDLLPLEGFESWRSLLAPGAPRRVLLFIHGFGSSSASSSARAFLPQFAAGYDAVLCYDHPTISRDPMENARDLLQQIPGDLQLSIDVLAHSRGGLVARSLIELLDPVNHIVPRTVITHGTPHAGTRLADADRWDRLVSLGMTALSWLAASTGIAAWVPTALEYVLRAAAQSVFTLPGLAAMAPGSAFLQQLNAPNMALQERVRYATVASTFSVFGVAQPGFRQALHAFAVQTFIDAPNDLVVPTSSMTAVDEGTLSLPADRLYQANVDHFSYFRDPAVVEFVNHQLAAGS